MSRGARTNGPPHGITSAFFPITGLLVAALAFAAYRLHDSVPKKIGAAS